MLRSLMLFLKKVVIYCSLLVQMMPWRRHGIIVLLLLIVYCEASPLKEAVKRSRIVVRIQYLIRITFLQFVSLFIQACYSCCLNKYPGVKQFIGMEYKH